MSARKKNLPVTFERKFYLARHLGTHGNVLFRSAKNSWHDGECVREHTVCDVMFANVKALAVTESYFPLEISIADGEMKLELEKFLGLDSSLDGNVYLLNGLHSLGYVCAGAVYWVDDPYGDIEEETVLLASSEKQNSIEIYRD